MFKKIGHRVVTFDAANEGAPGGTGADAHPVAPWSGAEGAWSFGEGDAAKPWWSAVPEDGARQTLEAKGYKNPAELALAYHNLTKLQRGDPAVIGLPGAEATPEELNTFYGKLGRPEKPEGYEFKFAEGFKPDDGMMNFARATFHEAGLTPKQAQIVADKWNAFAAEQNTGITTQAQETNEAELAALQSKWGAELDTNKAAGMRVVQALGLDAALVGRVEQQIGSAAVVELLATIGRKADEGAFVNSGSGDPNDPATMTKEQASAKIAELQSSSEFQAKYTDKNHPGHADAVKTMERLYSRV